jgi:hypothetical protein
MLAPYTGPCNGRRNCPAVPYGSFGRTLVASSSYDCDGMAAGFDKDLSIYDALGSILGNSPPGAWFDFPDGVCSSGPLDFWYRADGNTYQVYHQDGDGAVVAECFWNGEQGGKICWHRGVML